jgi:hypothetical protein
MSFHSNSADRMLIHSTGRIAVGSNPTDTSRFFLMEQAENITTLEAHGTHASYTGTSVLANATRAASADYKLFAGYTGNVSNLAFKVAGDGNVSADGTFSGNGADYQEWFESLDGSELEIGKAVVLDGDKVRIYNAATDSADNILGITRPQADNKNSAMIGNTAFNHWTDKYLTDDWGVFIREDVTVWEWDAVEATESDEAIPAGSVYEYKQPDGWTPPAGATSSTESIRKLNPDYNKPNLSDERDAWDDEGYAPRADRDEWNLIGLLGQVQIKADEATNPRWLKMKDISDAVEMWMIR